MALLDLFTGGKSGDSESAMRDSIRALQQLQTPTTAQMTLPELQKYSVAANMTPAQMQAFLQQKNALEGMTIDQAGTTAQKQAINQLAQVANAGAEGSPTQRAQVEQINQDAARNLAGQRGAIEQQAAARGVPVGLLQAALSGQQAGQGLQDAHMAALQSQGQNYQQALQAMAQGGALGGQLQGQQNTQANTVANAANAMAQFNAANQTAASAQNAQNQQGANLYNTQTANQVGQANTGLANERTQYNTALPQQDYANQLAKANAISGGYKNLADLYSNQGKQNAGIYSGLIGAGATLAGGMMNKPGVAATGTQATGSAFPQGDSSMKSSVGYDAYQNNPYLTGNLGFAQGGMVKPKGEVIQPYADGGVCMPQGGMVPGRAKVPGDSYRNDTVTAKLSPGELVVPRTAVPKVMGMMAQHAAPDHHPQDVAALLTAMRHLRGVAA